MDNLHPILIANALGNRRGFALLDSSLHDDDSISIVAWEPEYSAHGDVKTSSLSDQLLAFEVDIYGTALQPQSPIAIGALSFDGLYQFGIYHHYLVFHHKTKQWTFNNPNDKTWLNDLVSSGLTSRTVDQAITSNTKPQPQLNLQPSISPHTYQTWVTRAKDYIAAGDIYQVCLSYPWLGRYDGDPWSLYCQLRETSPAPFGCFIRLSDQFLLSISPELFLRINGRRIQTKPIKGTRPRGNTPEENAQLAHELIASEKERAELLMITDLERNDLGKICEIGSVTVDKLFALEEFAQVHHLVSTVSGTLRPEISHSEALISCSPGGSITGAPKKRAIEIINEIEQYPRGYYTGSTGIIGLNGQSIFNINIRTLSLIGSSASYFTGAGIVADSSPAAEWNETLVKALPVVMPHSNRTPKRVL